MPAFTRSDDDASVLNAYPIRVMLGLLASLILITIAFHLPIREVPEAVGWGRSFSEPISLQDRTEAQDETKDQRVPEPPKAPLSTFTAAQKQSPPTQKDLRSTNEVSDPSEGSRERSSDEGKASKNRRGSVQPIAPLSTLSQEPHVIGGRSAFYLNIPYPVAAQKKGVQGRLRVEFTVEKDGRTSNIQVAKSLHPLCDSAAVRTLRTTRFTPGHRDGKKVRVRMRLPVRFKLIQQAPLAQLQ